MSKSVDVILGAVKSAGEAALRLHEENKALAARLAGVEALLREIEAAGGASVDICDLRAVLAAPDSATHREDGSHG